MTNPFSIKESSRSSIPSAKRIQGFIEGEKPPFEYINQAIFESVTDHVWGTETQVKSSLDATFYTDASGSPLDSSDSAATIATDDKILIAHNSAQTVNDLVLSTTAERLTVEMLKGNTLDLGDSGGGVPFGLQLDIKNARLCDIYTTQDFADLSTLTDEQQRVVKNRGEGNRIKLNGRQIFSGGRPTELFWPTAIDDPYVISQNGFSFEGFKVSGSNDDVCLFTDWWKAWKGLDIVGDGSILIPPIFNPATGSLQRKVFSSDDAGRFMRFNTPIGGSTGVDPDVHSRTSPSTLATIATYTSSASNEISGILDADAIKLKIGARVQATGVLGGTTNTTIISRIIHTGTDDNSIFLIDSETGGDVVVSATGNLTIDMSGNSGVSHQLDETKFPTNAIITTSDLNRADWGAGSGSTFPGYLVQTRTVPTGAESRGISGQQQSYLIM